MPDQITLTTRKQLDIYMNPQRQRLLKTMDICAVPMTAKQLSVQLGISASSISHHLKKLEELGVVGFHHSESIHGIQAKYYMRLPVVVNMGSDRKDDLEAERTLLSDYFISETWNGFKEHMKQVGDRSNPLETGDTMNAIIYLTEDEVIHANQLLLEFFSSHMEPGPGTVPWEAAMIAFPHRSYTDGKDQEKGGES